jgi:hypothetical protein
VVRAGSNSQTPIYRCTAHAHLSCSIGLVDDVVGAFVYDLLQRDQVDVSARRSVPTDLHNQIAVVELALERCENHLVDGRLSEEAYDRNHARLTAQLNDLEQQRALLIVPGPMDGVTPEMWLPGPQQLPLDRRRKIIAHKLDVTLLPSNGKRRDVRRILIKEKRR